MKFINKKIDFSKVKNSDQLHKVLKIALGFPDFYGNNINALIDCLSGLRYPEEGMINISLEKDEILVFTIQNLDTLEKDLLYLLLGAIQSVNKRQLDKGNEPCVFLNVV